MGVVGCEYEIDASTLAERLTSMYDHWREHKVELWGSCNVFAVALPKSDCSTKSSALHLYLFGLVFADTLMVFSDKQIHILCSQKQKAVLDIVKNPAKDVVAVDVVFYEKQKSDDRSNQMDTILRAVKSFDPTFGHVAKEASEVKLSEKWTEKLKSSGFQVSDITNGLEDLFRVKTTSELTNVRISACLTASVMKKLVVPMLEQVIDKKEKVTHSILTKKTEKQVDVYLQKKKNLENLNASRVKSCYIPIFQSGRTFDVKLREESNNYNLEYGSASVIICALGYSYNGYCTHVARSILIDPNATQKKAYQVLLKAHDSAISALRPGNMASDVYKAALSAVEKYGPEFTANLTKSAGCGIGIELHESGLNLTEMNERILKAGMVFSVSLGFQNLQINSKTERPNYALLLADTVIVTDDDKDVVTSDSSKAILDVAYHTKYVKEVVYPFNPYPFNPANDDINLLIGNSELIENFEV